jgi:hypothetical protein
MYNICIVRLFIGDIDAGDTSYTFIETVTSETKDHIIYKTIGRNR